MPNFVKFSELQISATRFSSAWISSFAVLPLFFLRVENATKRLDDEKDTKRLGSFAGKGPLPHGRLRRSVYQIIGIDRASAFDFSFDLTPRAVPVKQTLFPIFVLGIFVTCSGKHSGSPSERCVHV
jgi:hypothetical protein